MRKTWKHLSTTRKLALIGLIAFAISLPVTVIGSALETRTSSQAYTALIKENLVKMPPSRDFERLPKPITITQPSNVSSSCRIGGCNGELCLGVNDPEINTICAIPDGETSETSCRNHYGTCQLQASGSCGWSYSEKYYACLAESDNEEKEYLTQPIEETELELEEELLLAKPMCGNGVCDAKEEDQQLCTKSRPPQCKTVPGGCPQDCRKSMCGNGICDEGEKDLEVCTKSIPPQCQIITGICNQDCLLKPTQADSAICTLQCVDGSVLDEQSCSCRFPEDSQPQPNALERNALQTTPIPSKATGDQACNQSGGSLMRMGSCGDSCDIITDPLIACPSGEDSVSCDCGPSKCWNGNTCVTNPKSSQNPYNKFGHFDFFLSPILSRFFDVFN